MISPSPLTRFAPAPTGYLHLGHVANAIFVWGLARARGGRVLLRIEDHDRGRCRPEYETALLDDLEWLGLEPDLGPIGTFRRGLSPFRQSDCHEYYTAALERLRQTGRVYVCDCSRKRISASTSSALSAETAYSGRCRDRGLEPGPGRGLRLVMEPGVEQFDDVLLGEQRQEPAQQCGDLLLRDRLGNWTYQFAVVADDLRQGVTLVIRGRDLLDSTGRQLRLGRLLGQSDPPAFLHHPLILKPSGEKLSKANRDTAIRELLAAGVAPEEVLGRAAFLTGLLPATRRLSPANLAGLFSVMEG